LLLGAGLALLLGASYVELLVVDVDDEVVE
jgi:hypothetical protein